MGKGSQRRNTGLTKEQRITTALARERAIQEESRQRQARLAEALLKLALARKKEREEEKKNEES